MLSASSPWGAKRPLQLSDSPARALFGTPASQTGRRRHRSLPRVVMRAGQGGQGETGKASQGLGILTWAGGLIPQGLLVKVAKTGWRLAWLTLMRELAPQSKEGEFARPSYAFGASIGDPDFPVESGRYHLYVGNACPWCHRVLLVLALTGLSRHITFTWCEANPEKASRGGWIFEGKDPVFGCSDLREVYDLLSPGYRGRCTAPLLVDTKARRIVCNESSLLVRRLGSLTMEGGTGVELCPKGLAAEIDAWNDRIYHAVNNGVYRSGFATSQAAYDRVQDELYSTLDELDGLLAKQRFVCGDRFTEADLRLFPTIVRFDAVYATLFKCCRKRVADYPHLLAWARDVQRIAVPGGGLQVQDCFDMDDARRSYYSSLFPLNPGGIIPPGPTAADLGLDGSGPDPGRGPSDSLGDIFHLRTPAPAPEPSAV